MGRSLTLRQQAALIRLHFGNVALWHEYKDGEPVLCTRLEVQPTPANQRYQLLIRYRIGFRPQVFIERPKLAASPKGHWPPHLFEGYALCLHDSTGKEWSGDQALVYTVIQWTKRWLLHYEYWLEYDEWLGDAEVSGSSPGEDALSRLKEATQ